MRRKMKRPIILGAIGDASAACTHCAIEDAEFLALIEVMRIILDIVSARISKIRRSSRVHLQISGPHEP